MEIVMAPRITGGDVTGTLMTTSTAANETIEDIAAATRAQNGSSFICTDGALARAAAASEIS
jgi:hypothetical protein